MTGILLDTSAYSALKRGHSQIVPWVRKSERIHVNPIVLGELRAGFARGSRREVNEEDLRRFLESSRVTVVTIDEETSEHYARLVLELRDQGTPLPTHDVWIAASAMQHGLKVITTDRHFLKAPGLLVQHYPPDGSGLPG